jgi:hypothetical protein
MTHKTPEQKDAIAAAKFFAKMFGDEQLQKDLEDGRTFKWRPKKGITTEELAACMYLVPLVVTYQHWQTQIKIYDALPDCAKKHFEVCSIHEESE